MKGLLLTTTILTSLSSLTLANSNNDYYFKLQPETVFDVVSLIKENSSAQTEKTTELDKVFMNIAQGINIEFGKYLNDYFTLGISYSFVFNSDGATFVNRKMKLLPKLNLITYKSDDTTIALGAGIGYHIQMYLGRGAQIRGVDPGVIEGVFRGVIGEINLNIATNINPTANIGLDLGISYSRLSMKNLYGLQQEEISTTNKSAEKWKAIGFSLGLSAQLSL